MEIVSGKSLSCQSVEFEGEGEAERKRETGKEGTGAGKGILECERRKEVGSGITTKYNG